MHFHNKLHKLKKNVIRDSPCNHTQKDKNNNIPFKINKM